jgi:hypothetical protein
MLRKGAKQARFYSPVILRGTLYVSAAALGVMMKTLLEWKAHENSITDLDVKILWVSTAWTSATVWATYVDKTFARFSDEKKERDKKQADTEAFARLPGGGQAKTQPGKLTHLG